MGEPDGQLHYGMQLLFGNSFELITNPERGLHWIQQSANQQHPDALYLLFRISAQQQNVTLSGHYFIRAAEAGCVDAQCYFLLNSNEEIQRISPEINVEELRGKIKILFLGQDDDIILEIHDFDINDVVRYLRSDMNDTEYLNKSLSLLEKMAKKQGLTSKPKIKSFIKAFDVPQHKFSQNAPMIHEVKEEIIIDKSYSFRNKTKISDTPFITLLKAQSSLAFFAIKNLSDNIDAVVQCKEENDYARIKQLQTKRKCKGKFFNAKSKKKYFVIEGVNLLSSEEEKHSIPEQTKSNLTRKTTVKL
jgi:TPR repeat protein